jgi:hypothetical protein
MMGTKEKLKGGDEYDFLTRARKWIGHRSGEVKRVKRRFWKRIRAQWKGKHNDQKD